MRERWGAVCVAVCGGWAVAGASSTSGQPDMLITVDNMSGESWRITSEFLSQLFVPTQIWASASFDLAGDGTDITITDYNASYDTALGPAQVTNGPTASFVGNASSFFGTPDLSNPLFVLDFEYAGRFDALELSLVGLNGIVDEFSFGSLILYQDSLGNPGSLTWDVQYIPGPATVALAPMTLIAARRRRSSP